MRKLNLDDLKEGLEGISPTRGAYYREAAIVCLMNKGFSPGIVLTVYGVFKEDLQIIWSEDIDRNTLNSWRDEHHSSNFGAVGIALLIMAKLLNYNTFEESVIGTGIDFWVGKSQFQKEQSTFAEREARLEISGIGTEKPGNTVNMRIGKKKKQISRSDKSELIGWIVVVEFSTPKSKIIKK